MKKLLQESLLTEGTLPSGQTYMSINDFSHAMAEFYDSINSFEKFLDDETLMHLLAARPHLDAAWKSETEDHGVDFEVYPFL